VTGRLLIDEDVLREAGVHDLDSYAVGGPGALLDEDFFLDPLPSPVHTQGRAEPQGAP
jgi:hypothetical protein